jgi:uncharacterized protein (DUF305 family)
LNIEEGDLRLLQREGLHDGFADAAGAAGDHGHAVAQAGVDCRVRCACHGRSNKILSVGKHRICGRFSENLVHWIFMARRFRILPILLLGSAAVAATAQTAPAPVVQPGAPGQPSKTLPANTRPPLPPLSAADVSFMQGMIMHHNQAVVMTALIPSRTQNPEVRELGKKISISQTDEMKFMKHWLEARGQATDMSMPGMPDMDRTGNPMPLMPGMLTPEQMEALRHATGAKFDHLFLAGMIQHHTGALTMVHELFNSPGAGQDADLFNFATDVDNTQRAEINIMQNLLLKEKK